MSSIETLPRQHPLRDSLYAELHARPYPVLQAPMQVVHLGILLTTDEKDAEWQHLQQLCRDYGVNPPSDGATSYQQSFAEFELRWERHLEFVTYTFYRPSTQAHLPFKYSPLDFLAPAWLAKLPGQMVVALKLEVHAKNQPWDRQDLSICFEGQRLISAQLMEGQATLWSAFRLQGDNFERILLYIDKLNPNQTGRLVQRVLELETYRLMALLGLNPARTLAPELARMDADLAKMIAQIPILENLDQERELLQSLSQLAAQVEAHRGETNSRFRATQAYYHLVLQRLKELREANTGQRIHLGTFIERRLTPAYHTCTSVTQGLEDLARRIERASDLLRTRVDLTIEAQNQHLLASMNRRSRLQLRLQETVEGLSIAAISYYGVSLFKLILDAGYAAGLPINKELITGISVPIILVGVWWITHRIKHFIMRASQDTPAP
ncbi:Uncharacterized membrane-anchored protein [Allopseudospirillum japonicum]|uniref:Uncharacterized membrane-anchored protein n=1 Tax=Allopseudospirillum japonicum TaxID=64971 RepID=A0A1H6T030_9GAMM|nr:DUF3422 domain-containing protein [Allopseudospirillum japonicum]SEI71464.1 Uncharacterized membrane-anchored protein [Allopseudospirillum japonicum]